MTDDKVVANWEGDEGEFEISAHQEIIVLGLDSADPGLLEPYSEISMSRADTMAVIAGLQNALRQLDDE